MDDLDDHMAPAIHPKNLKKVKNACPQAAGIPNGINQELKFGSPKRTTIPPLHSMLSGRYYALGIFHVLMVFASFLPSFPTSVSMCTFCEFLIFLVIHPVFDTPLAVLDARSLSRVEKQAELEQRGSSELRDATDPCRA